MGFWIYIITPSAIGFAVHVMWEMRGCLDRYWQYCWKWNRSAFPLYGLAYRKRIQPLFEYRNPIYIPCSWKKFGRGWPQLCQAWPRIRNGVGFSCNEACLTTSSCNDMPRFLCDHRELHAMECPLWLVFSPNSGREESESEGSSRWTTNQLLPSY